LNKAKLGVVVVVGKPKIRAALRLAVVRAGGPPCAVTLGPTAALCRMWPLCLCPTSPPAMVSSVAPMAPFRALTLLAAKVLSMPYAAATCILPTSPPAKMPGLPPKEL